MVSASPRTNANPDHSTDGWKVITQEALSTPEDRGEGPSTPSSPNLDQHQHMLPSDDVEPVPGQEPDEEENGENGATHGSVPPTQQVAVVSAVDGADHSAEPGPAAGPGPSRAPSQVVHPSSVGDDRPPSGDMPPVSSSANSTTTPAQSSHPHLDLATFPTPDLLKLLASLLQQIAQANDALRPETSSVTVDQATHDSPTSAGPASDPSQAVPVRPTNSRASSSTSSGGFGSRRITAESLVIPPYRPKPLQTTSPSSATSTAAIASPPPATPAKSTSSTVPTASSDSTSVAPPSRSTAQQRPNIQPTNAPTPRSRSNTSPFIHPEVFTASRQSISHPSSILCFHARNIPSISIEAYLQRILKYCPITNEVFLSLLVYFDRMSRTHVGSSAATMGGSSSSQDPAGSKEASTRGFAIDSYNVHRLVIAGITVASKFFSDVFYTNSRYAKVGGLPQSELNQLELQFLLLNDFRLVIPLEEMQKYADQLLVYWEAKKRSSRESTKVQGSPRRSSSAIPASNASKETHE